MSFIKKLSFLMFLSTNTSFKSTVVPEMDFMRLNGMSQCYTADTDAKSPSRVLLYESVTQTQSASSLHNPLSSE